MSNYEACTLCAGRDEEVAPGGELVGIYVHVRKNAPLCVFVPATRECPQGGFYCDPPALRRMALQLVAFADAIDKGDLP